LNTVRHLFLATTLCLAACTTGTSNDTAVPAGATGGATPGPAEATPGPAGATPGSATGGCAPRVTTGALPGWARSGFSDGATVPHVVGDRGDLVAVLFGHPLHQPPLGHRRNKILWVSRVPVVPGDPLTIDARLDATGRSVSRQVPGGPGPSIVDLPQPGCWTLTLTWSGHTDVMDLLYVTS
jgi:hypothetical protein